MIRRRCEICTGIVYVSIHLMHVHMTISLTQQRRVQFRSSTLWPLEWADPLLRRSGSCPLWAVFFMCVLLLCVRVCFSLLSLFPTDMMAEKDAAVDEYKRREQASSGRLQFAARYLFLVQYHSTNPTFHVRNELTIFVFCFFVLPCSVFLCTRRSWRGYLFERWCETNIIQPTRNLSPTLSQSEQT